MEVFSIEYEQADLETQVLVGTEYINDLVDRGYWEDLATDINREQFPKPVRDLAIRKLPDVCKAAIERYTKQRDYPLIQRMLYSYDSLIPEEIQILAARSLIQLFIKEQDLDSLGSLKSRIGLSDIVKKAIEPDFPNL